MADRRDRRVTYSMSTSSDGYIVGPDGSFDWGAPEPEVFRFWIDEIRGVGVHLMGRRLYETMLYWETADRPDRPRSAVVLSEPGFNRVGQLVDRPIRWRGSPSRRRLRPRRTLRRMSRGHRRGSRLPEARAIDQRRMRG